MILKRVAKGLLRLGITAGAITYAFSKVNVAEMWPLLTHIALLPLLGAVLVLHIGQYASAMRLRYYLHCQKVDFPPKPALQLHYIGGLFNALLPGSTGGDVYKAWWLKHYTKGSMLNLVKIMVIGRLNGLWVLGSLICLVALASTPIRTFLPTGAPLALLAAGWLGYHALARFLLKEPLAQQYRAAPYSIILQLTMFASAWFLASGLGIDTHRLEYVELFLVSCVLAMLPISIGGVGVRELAVLYGSKWLGLTDHEGVALAFAFSVINLSIPLAGAVVYAIWKPHRNDP